MVGLPENVTSSYRLLFSPGSCGQVLKKKREEVKDKRKLACEREMMHGVCL